jgi:hypothetical protein
MEPPKVRIFGVKQLLESVNGYSVFTEEGNIDFVLDTDELQNNDLGLVANDYSKLTPILLEYIKLLESRLDSIENHFRGAKNDRNEKESKARAIMIKELKALGISDEGISEKMKHFILEE